MCNAMGNIMEDIILVGYGGHAKSIADCIERSKIYNIIGYTDENDRNCVYQYLGNDDVLSEYIKKGYNKVAICIGYLGVGNVREQFYNKLKAMGFEFPVICDPSAIISPTATLDEGCFIGKNVVINSEAQIGKMCIINTGAIVEHECIVDEYSHIAVGAVLCGQVKIGRAVLIGANATVIQCRSVADGMIVPAGAVIR